MNQIIEKSIVERTFRHPSETPQGIRYTHLIKSGADQSSQEFKDAKRAYHSTPEYLYEQKLLKEAAAKRRAEELKIESEIRTLRGKVSPAAWIAISSGMDALAFMDTEAADEITRCDCGSFYHLDDQIKDGDEDYCSEECHDAHLQEVSHNKFYGWTR